MSSTAGFRQTNSEQVSWGEPVFTRHALLSNHRTEEASQEPCDAFSHWSSTHESSFFFSLGD